MGEKEGKDENKKENKAAESKNRGGDNNSKNKEEGGGGGGGGGENKNKGGDNKNKNKEEGGGGGGEKKKEDGPISVVLKVDIHCEGCALKIKNSVKNFEGVDAVSTDMANNKVTVVGKVDPWKIRERVESKTRKRVDLISPANPPKKDAEPKKAQSDSKDKKKPDGEKPKEPAVSTVVLKIRLHCEGCIRRIRRTILRIKGVETVNIDSQKDLVTVKGAMDPNALPSYLKDKLKRAVEIVPQKKEPAGGGGDKKEKSGDGGDKKDKGGDDKKAKEGGGGR
ncbi:uncharacterized protein A4U43_C10F16260 [Asparagus officinalis]|uniref:HMA domain-containing protein n=1 Tax=Asparagus officinalis TaxID=4686 RepID=A0A5P1E803_ASPOF|nr:heavy metal-associated isoprenylated plant protein 3-like [Asparagus officinalis]ONK57066.1 uncharacterized protein A4U43_C10F16260 [Asparagus officinalis]